MVRTVFLLFCNDIGAFLLPLHLVYNVTFSTLTQLKLATRGAAVFL